MNRALRVTLLGLAVVALLLGGLLAACGASNNESQSFTTSTTLTAPTLNEWAANVCSAHSTYALNALKGSGTLSRKLRRLYREQFEKGNWREDTARLIPPDDLRDEITRLRGVNDEFIAALMALRPARGSEAGRVRRSLIDSSIEGARDYAERLRVVATTKLGRSPSADEILYAGNEVLLAGAGAAEASLDPATRVGSSKHPALVRAFNVTPACRSWRKDIALGEAFVSKRAERCRARGGFITLGPQGVRCIENKKVIDSWTPKP